MAPRRQFTSEFKIDILRQAEQRLVSEICREYDLHPTLVNRWKSEQNQYRGKAFKGKGKMYKVEAKLPEAQCLIGQLYAENELLKKAITLEKEKQEEERMLRSTQ
jgi:transposase